MADTPAPAPASAAPSAPPTVAADTSAVPLSQVAPQSQASDAGGSSSAGAAKPPEGGATPPAGTHGSLWEQLTQGAHAAEPAPLELENQPAQAAEVKAKAPREQAARVFADMAQREANVAARDLELKKHEKDLDDYRKALEGLKTDPLGTLEKAGITYEQLTLAALKGKKGESPELAAVKSELRAEVTALKEDLAAKETNQAIAGYKAQLAQHLKDGADKYELTNARGDVEKVWDLMVKISQDSGGSVVPTFEQAASFYELQLEQEGEVIMATKKFQARRGAAPGTPPKPPPDAGEPEPKPAAKAKPVLSNAIVGASPTAQSQKPKTKEDAFAIFKRDMQKSFAPRGNP